MTAKNNAGVVIIGGGQAAAQTIASLRQNGYSAAITLIGEETDLPYQRPPLSKAYLKGEMSRERLYFRPQTWYDDQEISLRLGVRVQALDTANKSVSLPNGEALSFDKLVLATGSRPRILPLSGAGLEGVHYLRGIADIDSLSPKMTAGAKLVIIGAGYIGLEAAAVASQLGLDVTIIEMADRILARVTGPDLSTYFQDLHRRHGVNIRTQTASAEILGTNDKVQALKLADGEVLPADIILIGIGVLPNQELAEAGGIICENGIKVDADARTAHPDVFAAGDCTQRPLLPYGGHGRLESVHNALEQGKAVAAAITGKPRPKQDCPWFWSDQYDTKLQIAGLSTGYDTIVARGDTSTDKFALYYFKDGIHIATDAVNSAPDFLMSKRMILAQAKPDLEALKDTSIPIQTIAKALV